MKEQKSHLKIKKSYSKYKGKISPGKSVSNHWQTFIAFFLPFFFFSFSFNLQPGFLILKPAKVLKRTVVIGNEVKNYPVHREIVETEKILPVYHLPPQKLKVGGKVVWEGGNKKKKIALTFDDGPTKLTPKFLKILSRENVPATFFMLGWRARAHRELVKKVSQAGHEVGIHTYSHSDLSRLKPHQQQKEIVSTLRILQKNARQPIIWIRPPWGKYNSQTLKICKKIGRGIALWTVDSNDYQRPGDKKIEKKVLAEVKNGSVILMHETTTQSLGALPKIIRALKKQGFKFVTFSQLAFEN